MVPDGAKCEVCSTPCRSRCSNCQQVYYCNANHQRQDWKQHKLVCHPFIIKSNERYGRYLVASRTIKAGEIILKEQPLVCGPSQITGPICVGCMKGLNESDHFECDRCGWPICQRDCQDYPEHADECRVTVERGTKVKIQHFVAPHPMYQCLAALRCLLLKEKHPEKWQKFIRLESHDKERRGTPQWRSDYEGIAKFIPRFFKYTKFSEEEIMNVVGILQINGHEVPLSEPPYVAVYDYASLVEHSCLPNIAKTFSKDGEVMLWAPNEIKKDTHLSICYSDAMWGTSSRQHHLLQTKLFKCECVRCKDVTELNTNYSSIICNNKDCQGLALPLSLDAWDDDWKCQTCGKFVDKSYVNGILERAGKDLAAMEKGSVDNCLRYLNHYSKWLPPNHHYLCEVKVVLAQIIGAGGPEVLQSISDDELNRKMQLCKQMIQLYEKLAPSEIRILGLLSFELHASLAERGRRTSANDSDECTKSLEESLEYVEKAIKYLLHEPSILSEGQIYAQAKVNRDSLKVVMGLPL